MQAVFDSQIREKDNVDVLRSYLSGDAKTLIGTHFTDIKEALNTLVSYFGQPSRIWKNKLSRIMAKIGGDPRTCWGSESSQKRVMVISQLVEFLKDAEKLAETYKVLESDIYNEVNFNTIFKTIPIEIQRTFNHNVSDPSLTHKERFKGLANFMEEERVSAGEGLRNIGGGSTREKNSYSSQNGNADKKVHFADGDDSDDDSGCKICNGKSCKQEWDGLGCLEMYKLSDADARIKSWKKRNICFMCGIKRVNSRKDPNSNHRCGWMNKGKIHTRCQQSGCRYGAAMCVKHTDNFSEKLQKWLKSVLTNTTHLGFHINGPSSGGLHSSSGIITATTSFRCEDANSAKNISKSKRDKLQKGEIAMDMSDEELIPFFKNDLKNLQDEVNQMSEKFPMVM